MSSTTITNKGDGPANKDNRFLAPLLKVLNHYQNKPLFNKNSDGDIYVSEPELGFEFPVARALVPGSNGADLNVKTLSNGALIDILNFSGTLDEVAYFATNTFQNTTNLEVDVLVTSTASDGDIAGLGVEISVVNPDCDLDCETLDNSDTIFYLDTANAVQKHTFVFNDINLSNNSLAIFKFYRNGTLDSASEDLGLIAVLVRKT